MKPFKSHIILAGSLGLLFLAACNSSSNQTANTSTTTANSPAANPSVAASPATNEAQPGANDRHGGEPGKPMQGGQVIESGPYHLEFVPQPAANATHLDFYLQKGDTHAAIPNAKVTAQVQLPDGSQKSLDMKYDPQDQHYTAILPTTAAGEYKVAILTDIGGEKVNGRFSFNQ